MTDLNSSEKHGLDADNLITNLIMFAAVGAIIIIASFAGANLLYGDRIAKLEAAQITNENNLTQLAEDANICQFDSQTGVPQCFSVNQWMLQRFIQDGNVLLLHEQRIQAIESFLTQQQGGN